MRFRFIAAVCGAALALALAQPGSAAERLPGEAVSFPQHIPGQLPTTLLPTGFSPNLLQAPQPPSIPGTLRLPPGTGRVPAVVILHGTGGVDGRGEQYARALLAQGIATLEIDMWAARGISTQNAQARRPLVVLAMPDAYGALRFLASHPRIDQNRIGVMGMSFGANQALFASTTRVREFFGSAGVDFRAALSLYPVCWSFVEGGPNVHFVDENFPRIPYLLLIGDRDDYDGDGGAACRTLVSSGSEAARRRGSIHIFPGATHGWERPEPGLITFRDPAAARGRGGMVNIERNDAVTRDSIQRAVTFFRENLSAR